MKVTAQRRHYE